jgi:formiminotetrahydrofolate cyclodeaminase
MTAADQPLAALLDQVASGDPTPGAGPSMAWTCALAAALVEMVCAVELRKEPPDQAANARRRERAAELRASALELADADAVAYGEVIAVLRRRGEPGHGQRLRDALSDAAEPPAALAGTAAEVARLAADAAADARGAVRGEAVTAAVLAEAAVRAAQRIVALNLGGAAGDPRRARVDALAASARADLERATGT